jgi:iron complex outermembrane receptor protein
VNSIIAQGLNPADYLTASTSSPSGWVELNPIYTEFPGGYSPIFGADIKDYSVVAGARGLVNTDLSWDFTLRTAEDEVSYVLEGSINPSLGRLSPTTFNPGTLTQEESGANLDFVKTFSNSPLNLAFGLEWRWMKPTRSEQVMKVRPKLGPRIRFSASVRRFGLLPATVGSDGDSYAALRRLPRPT